MRQEVQGEAAWIYRKVLSHPLVPAFLQQRESDGIPIHVGWGYRPSGRAAKQAAQRKGGRLTLDELVCGALMKYPQYLNPATGEFTTSLKVTRLLASEGVAVDQRALHLKTVPLLKRSWLKFARKPGRG